MESVHTTRNKPYVAHETVGERLRRMWEGSGLSMKAFAVAAGFSAASGVQRYLDPGFDKALAVDLAVRFADVLEGKGSPPIARDDVIALAGLPLHTEGRPVRFEGASQERMREDIPIQGTALGAAAIIDGEAIEQTMLNTGDIVSYAKRPVVLNGRSDVYGLYVVGSSMYPRYSEGELVFVERNRPPRVGDDVIVYLRDMDDDGGERVASCLAKRLVRRTAQYVELEQFTPAISFRIDAQRVHKVDRIIPWAELLS